MSVSERLLREAHELELNAAHFREQAEVDPKAENSAASFTIAALVVRLVADAFAEERAAA